jgi:hypothetical protein
MKVSKIKLMVNIDADSMMKVGNLKERVFNNSCIPVT